MTKLDIHVSHNENKEVLFRLHNKVLTIYPSGACEFHQKKANSISSLCLDYDIFYPLEIFLHL